MRPNAAENFNRGDCGQRADESECLNELRVLKETDQLHPPGRTAALHSKLPHWHETKDNRGRARRITASKLRGMDPAGEWDNIIPCDHNQPG